MKLCCNKRVRGIYEEVGKGGETKGNNNDNNKRPLRALAGDFRRRLLANIYLLKSFPTLLAPPSPILSLRDGVDNIW